MLTLKCTKSVQDLVGLKPADLVVPSSSAGILGAWYVNQFSLGRRKALIFMSETTLASFVHVGVKKPDLEKSRFPYIFLDGLFLFLRMGDFSPEEIGRVMDDCHSWQYAKTDSRSSLGNMNELMSHYQFYLGPDGDGADAHEMYRQINRMPQSNLKFRNAIEAAQFSLRSAAT